MASIIKINLDTSKENYILAKCKQNDDLTLEASIFENGLEKDLTNAAITIQALKADKTYIIQNTNITKENNKIIADLDRDFTRAAGKTEIEILLVESSKQNTTFSFSLEVVGSVIRGAVESSNTVTILEELGNKIVEAGQVRDETEQLIQSGGAATTGDIQEINSQLEQSKQELNVLKPKVDSLASGSPKGTFATLSALQGDTTANTIEGKKNVYVVTADGGWYYWNGNSWVKGGIYQSTGIGNATVEDKKLKSRKVSKNLFDIDNYNIYKGYNSSGIFTDNAASFAIVLEIEPNTQYTIHHSLALANRHNVCTSELYPANGIAYTNYVSAAQENLTITSGVNDKYLYIWLYYGDLTNLDTNKLLEGFQVEKGSSYTGYREHYILDVKNDNLEDGCVKINNLSQDVKDKLINTNILFGKKGLIFGDSFTAGANRYHSYISQRTGATLLNYGLAGSAITPTTDQYANNFLERILSLPTDSDIKFVLIWGGINDSWVLSTNRRQLGTIDDTYSDINITVYGAMKKMCEDLINKYPNIPIIALLPPNIIDNNQSWAHAKNINTVCEALKNVYNKYSIPYLDMRSESGISTLQVHKALYNNKSSSTDDGYDMHWNNVAHEKISYTIQKFIENHLSN